MTTDTDLSRVNRRIFLVGLNTGFVTGGEPDQRLIDFYADRSSPALYCAIVGNVVIPEGYPTNSATPRISRSKVWSKIARAIAGQGTLPGIQLATAWEGYQGSQTFRSRKPAEVIAEARNLVLGWTSDRIARLFQQLVRATGIALEAGYKHVQLHAAHGYLFSLLIDERIFPGAEEVQHFVLDWLKQAKNDGAETSIRFSLRTGDAIFDAAGATRFQDSVAAMPVDYVDVSSGFYNIDKTLIYPGVPAVIQSRRRETIALAARNPAARFILSGRALYERREALPENVHIGLCRDLIANPVFLFDSSRGCKNCGKCHYFSRGAAHVTCPQWSSPPTAKSPKAR
jgi:2,4-dienoyl-CoA reductase-like NADH-dependent reductase (Old Yellow Enzyme family)